MTETTNVETRILERKVLMLNRELATTNRENISLRHQVRRLAPYADKYDRAFIECQNLKELLADANANIEGMLKRLQKRK